MDIKQLFTLFRNHTHTGAYPDAKKLPPWAITIPGNPTAIGLLSSNNTRYAIGVSDDGAFTVEAVPFSTLLTSLDGTRYIIGIDSDGTPTTAPASTLLGSISFAPAIQLYDSLGSPFLLYVTLDGYLETRPGVVAAPACSGSHMWFDGPLTRLPFGYLLKDGSEYLKSDYPNLYYAIGDLHNTPAPSSSLYFRVPNMVDGRFIRSIGGEAGSVVGVLQDHIIESHTHVQNAHLHTQTIGSDTSPNGSGARTGYYAASNATLTGDSTTATNQSTGGAETRPMNISSLPCIKW